MSNTKTDNRYKIEGSGPTTKEADAVLEKERSKLVKKLGDEKAPTKLDVAEVEYEGEFNVKDSMKENYYTKKITLSSTKSWAELNRVASDKLNINDYDAKYNVQEFIELTDKQKEALNPSAKPKTAGYEPRTSSIDGFLKRL